MKLYKTTLFASLFLVTACGSAAKEGEECTADADCEEGLHCEMHEGEEDHGECADDHDHEGEDHEGEDDHDEEDHEGEEE